MSQQYAVNAPRVIHQAFDGEVVAIDLGSGAYYSMNGPAAVAWSALDAGLAADTVAEHLRATHEPGEADVEADVGALIDDLVARELIVPDEREAGDPPSPGDGLAYEAPAIEAFTDMADVILLDPVHDIDADAGWPHQPPAADAP